MRSSVTIFLTDQTIACRGRARVRGAWSSRLYLPEHTHNPTNRATPAPMGEPLLHYYERCVDPFVALMAAAAATNACASARASAW